MPEAQTNTQQSAMDLFISTQKPRLLMIVDGHAMVYRGWFALVQQSMTLRRTGEEVKGVYGFTSMLFKALADWKPSHVIIAFDSHGPTFRHEQFTSYKAQRPEAAPEFRKQIMWAKKLMDAMHVPILEVPGYEADDIIGCICKKTTAEEIETIIVTGDTDTLQLVSPHVRVVLQYGIGEMKVYDELAVRERYDGLDPRQQPDVKALQGDTSDNIKGVPGIGAKTAVKLVKEFGSIEGMYQNIDKVTPPRIRELLRQYEGDARQSKFLTTIETTVPCDIDFHKALFGTYTREEVLEVFHALEFNSLVPRIPSPLGETQPAPAASVTQAGATILPADGGPTTTIIVNTKAALDDMVKELKAASVVSMDIETDSLDPMRSSLVGIAFSIKPGNAWYVPVGHREGDQLTIDDVIPAVRPILEDNAIQKVAYNANFDLSVLASYGIMPSSVNLAFDVMIAAHLLGDKATGLKALAFSRLHIEMTQITELLGTGRKQVTFDYVTIDKAAAYAGADADISLRLKMLFEQELQAQGLLELLTKHEMPLLPVIVQMQLNGITLDIEAMKDLARELDESLARLEGEIYDSVGHRFNINSPGQFGELLFTELKLPKGKKTQTGYSTDAATLEALKDAHPVVRLVLQFREISKLKGTYVDSLPMLINPRTGRLHTTYNQAGSATGRISSNDPNLQNIPVRTELGKRVRKAFIAPADGWALFAADYSQIELRVLAHLSRDPELIAAFERGEDIHAATAAKIYHVPLNEVKPDMRRLAKVMNFGVIYGLSPYGIAQQTDLTVEEGAKFIETYFGTYPHIRQYLAETIAVARHKGYVETLLGRRRYLPELKASNVQVRNAGERMAVNAPVQGTAAEVIKEAMVALQHRLNASRLKARMLLQVHDELIFETPGSELNDLKGLVLEIMPHAIELIVPVKVDVKAGRTWGDME